jgi:hypothetical protein
MKKEVQGHGLIWENSILRNIYGATEEELKKVSYTSRIDLPAEYNHLDECDLSIKTTGKINTVCMGDWKSVFVTVSSGNIIHMTVINYNQCESVKKVNNIVEVNLSDSKNELFGDISREELVKLEKLIKSVPANRKPAYDEHKNMYDYRNEILVNKGQIMLNIKCNSQQSRL